MPRQLCRGATRLDTHAIWTTFVAHGGDIAAFRLRGRTALMVASAVPPFHTLNVAEIRFLLDHGVDPTTTVRGAYGRTVNAISFAARGPASFRTVSTLLMHGLAPTDADCAPDPDCDLRPVARAGFRAIDEMLTAAVTPGHGYTIFRGDLSVLTWLFTSATTDVGAPRRADLLATFRRCNANPNAWLNNADDVHRHAAHLRRLIYNGTTVGWTPRSSSL